MSPQQGSTDENSVQDTRTRFQKAWAFVVLHAKHTGVGIVCSVAYFDPGNWGVDLQAGSQYGYRLLTVVLTAGIFAVFLQVLATRLGCVTGLDLATHSRLLLYNRGKYPRITRWLTLYPLYVLAEVAIIATDLAELLGSAIALCLLFPRLELWHGVLLTGLDVFLILALGDPLRGRPARTFEILIGIMVMAVLICMAIVISQVGVKWAQAFYGYLPSKVVFGSGALYISIGIIGATVMPHSLFLGSALATQDRIKMRPMEGDDPLDGSPYAAQRSQPILVKVMEYTKSFFKAPPPSTSATRAKGYEDHENNPYSFVKAHVYHGSADVVVSLLGYAVVINSMILILASTVFYYGHTITGDQDPASLFDAYFLIKDVMGQGAATLFAIALLAAGQSSSFIATVAGQAVAEGFIQWRISPMISRLLTRALAIIPAMIVAIAVGRSGINALLVVSQVILSVVLPFILFPLLYCTGSKKIMAVRNDLIDGKEVGDSDDAESGEQWVDFSNGKISIVIGWAIWLLIVAANSYVLISLAMGD